MRQLARSRTLSADLLGHNYITSSYKWSLSHTRRVILLSCYLYFLLSLSLSLPISLAPMLTVWPSVQCSGETLPPDSLFYRQMEKVTQAWRRHRFYSYTVWLKNEPVLKAPFNPRFVSNPISSKPLSEKVTSRCYKRLSYFKFQPPAGERSSGRNASCPLDVRSSKQSAPICYTITTLLNLIAHVWDCMGKGKGKAPLLPWNV